MTLTGGSPVAKKHSRRKRQATSMRQAAEWGMRAIQSSFPRLKDTFVYEETGERRIVMKMLCLLYNLRARTVGINRRRRRRRRILLLRRGGGGGSAAVVFVVVVVVARTTAAADRARPFPPSTSDLRRREHPRRHHRHLIDTPRTRREGRGRNLPE